MDAEHAGLTENIRSAMENGDLEAFLTLCAEDVHWGAPGATHGGCQNRDQVRSWYEAAFGRGVRATVKEVMPVPGGLVVGLEVSGSPTADADGPVERWQLLTIEQARITNICGFDHRDEAVAWAGGER